MKKLEKRACPTASSRVGGQAVIEGIMMKGPGMMATAIRKADGSILVDKKEDKSFIKKYKLNKIPILRGFLAFFESLFTGVSCLMFSAKECDLEDESYEMSKNEQWIMDKFGDKLFDILMYVSVLVSLVLGVGLFMVLPKLTVEWIGNLLGTSIHESLSVLIEGVIRITLFVIYMLLISRMKDVHRVFQYHGAEHKTIFTFEYGEELTVENVKKHTRFHPRCGTSFIIVMLVISIVISMFIPGRGSILRSLFKILLLPLSVGIGYEFIMFAGKHDNFIVRALSAPGLWMQRITTKEPDESQLEIAITALKGAIPAEFPEAEVNKPEADEKAEETAKTAGNAADAENEAL